MPPDWALFEEFRPHFRQEFIFGRGVSPPAIPFLLVVSRYCGILLSRLGHFFGKPLVA